MENSKIIDFLSELKIKVDTVSDVIAIERVIDLIKPKEVDNIFSQDCIIDWEVYHKFKGSKDTKIETEYLFDKDTKIVLNRNDFRTLTEKAGIKDVDLDEYFIKMIDVAKEGKRSIIFESMKPEVMVSLEKLGFSVEWFDNEYEKGWLVKW